VSKLESEAYFGSAGSSDMLLTATGRRVVLNNLASCTQLREYEILEKRSFQVTLWRVKLSKLPRCKFYTEAQLQAPARSMRNTRLV